MKNSKKGEIVQTEVRNISEHNLSKYYVETLGDEHLPIAHKYQFIIDGEAAQKILKIYNFDRR